MKANDSTITRRRLRSSSLTAIISISLVLLLIGLIGLLLLNSSKLAGYVKENISLSLILRESAREVDIIRLQKNLDASGYVKSTEYVSQERAARELQQELGEDFVDFLGYNPLPASIDVYLHAPYANPDSIAWIERELAEDELVQEVFYQKSLIHLVHENVRKISLILLLFSTMLFLIALTLINNTIRISIYAKRFLINTMQLVGAQRSFIRRPFLARSAIQGLVAGLLACGLLSGGIYMVHQEFSEMLAFTDYYMILILFAGILFLGVVINWISTYFAVNKYLNMKTDKLYY
ncbi:MAG: cell division protein FtsX [Bacteroidales bacterium]